MPLDLKTWFPRWVNTDHRPRESGPYAVSSRVWRRSFVNRTCGGYGPPLWGGRRSLSALAAWFVIERQRVELEPMVDQPIAEFARDLRLQTLDLLGLELNH